LRTAAANGITRRVVVANKVTGEEDLDALRQFLGVEADIVVPADRAVVAADRAGASPLDHDAVSPAVGVLRQLASSLL
jgi:CO dehydrogenase nickel-insertion accessory protein CooC1